MSAPSSFNNKVLVASPAAASDINTMLAAQNALNFQCSDIKFQDSGLAVLLFGKVDTTYTAIVDQKVNFVDANQPDVDADKATEIADGWWPTGIFLDPSTPDTVVILYALLFPVA